MAHKGPASPPTEKPQGKLDTAMTTLTHFQRFAWDVGGILLLALALMTLLAILLPEAASGVLLGWWAGFLATWFG